MKTNKDKGLGEKQDATAQAEVRGKWTIDEVIELAKLAIDNALDNAGDERGLVAFQHEFEFQLNAPEHRGRPTPTPAQLAMALAIWNADTRTTHPNPADQPNSNTKEE